MERRDVLKILSAAPFLGLRPAPHAASGAQPASHPWRVFEDAFLSEIAFPLGGIGTGTVSLGGRGELRDWEIANKPDKGRMLDNSFFALWFHEEGVDPKTMILESELRPPYRGAFGIPGEASRECRGSRGDAFSALILSPASSSKTREYRSG